VGELWACDVHELIGTAHGLGRSGRAASVAVAGAVRDGVRPAGRLGGVSLTNASGEFEIGHRLAEVIVWSVVAASIGRVLAAWAGRKR
jgi:hypothetical protein